MFFEFTRTQAKKWFNPLLISVRCALQTCNIEVLRPRLFTLHPLRLIARKLAIVILTQQNVIVDTSLGCIQGDKYYFSMKLNLPDLSLRF
jgi:hypothetical protein